MAKNSIATAYVQIIPTTDGIKDDLNKQLGGAGDEAGKSSGNRFGAMFKKAIAAAGIGAAFKKTLDIGGELQQNLGGTEAVFGGFADAIQKSAEDAYKNMGLSASDYMATANKMASLFQGSGLAQERSLDLTTAAMQRAADVASVMGIDTASAMESIAGAAKGNFTMMDNLGVAMNATTLAAYALEQGVNFDWNTATNAEKAELAMKMFMDRTSQYEGNFAKESEETFSGALSALKSAGKNVLGNLALGKDIMPSLETLGDTVMTFLGKNLIPMAENVISALPGALSKIITKLAPILIPAGISLLTNFISGISKTSPQLLAQITALIPQMVTQIVNGLPQILNAGIELLMGIVKAIPQIIPPLVQALPQIVYQIVTTLFGMGPQIFSATLSALGSVVKAIPSILGNVVASAMGIGVNLVRGIWNGISGNDSWLIGKIKSFCSNALGAIKNFFGIHSPSKETAWMGEMLNAGLAKGINDNLGIVEDAVGDLRDTALDELNPTVHGEYSVSSASAENADVVRLLRTYLPRLAELAERDMTLSVNNREFARAVKAVG